MKTQIIPQIKEIELRTKKLELKDFFLDSKVLETLPIANDIFKNNEKGEALYPITYSYGELTKEAYRIIARVDKIEVISNNIRGLMYGLFTLSELAFINDDEMVEFDIYDEPTLKFRALSDDISRGQVSTTENFFEIIRKLARYKYNTYMPYIEDVFKFKSIPAWGRYSEPLSKEEWTAIIEYAKSYQLEVRPIVNLLGHFNKLCYIKELQPLALKYEDGKVSHVMDPKNPKVREIICDILDEIVDAFGEGVIHAGGDEPVDLTKVYGHDEGGHLFIEHYTFIANELKKRGCTLMMYADFFAPPWGDYAVPIDRARELPQETEFVFWDYAYRPEYPFVSALHNQRLKMYISPGSWTWKRFSCDVKTCFNNTKGLLKADEGKSLGMIMSSWADGGDTLRELVWPGVCIGANFCWSPNSDYSYNDIFELFHKSFYGFNKEEAWLLDPIYHQDSLIERQDEHEFKNQMFADPSEPITFGDKKNISVVQKAMEKAKVDLANLQPKRNIDAFNALHLTVARALFTANKIAKLPHEKIQTIEEGISYSSVALDLASDLIKIKELHRKLWFATNRNSEWELCECRYDDQYDQLRMFARNVKLRKQFISNL